jgi:lysophospholipase L1-like esterase
MRNLIFVFIGFLLSCSPLKKYENTANIFEDEISKLEQKDYQYKSSENSLLFIGSSSIRGWDKIKEDMIPYRTIKRGYGGAHYYDLIHFINRLVKNHNPKAILIFVANDITGSKNHKDLKPKEVKKLFKFIYKSIRKVHKNTPIIVIETTPTPSRWKVWDKISKANDLIERFCNSKQQLHYINTRKRFIGDDGLPIKSFFVKDMLHLNRSGYILWSNIIKENLKKMKI